MKQNIIDSFSSREALRKEILFKSLKFKKKHINVLQVFCK